MVARLTTIGRTPVAELSKPTTRVHASYVAAVREYQAEGGYPDFDGLDVGEPAAFARHVAQLRSNPVPRGALHGGLEVAS
jgi:hypothetical protein